MMQEELDDQESEVALAVDDDEPMMGESSIASVPATPSPVLPPVDSHYDDPWGTPPPVFVAKSTPADVPVVVETQEVTPVVQVESSNDTVIVENGVTDTAPVVEPTGSEDTTMSAMDEVPLEALPISTTPAPAPEQEPVTMESSTIITEMTTTETSNFVPAVTEVEDKKEKEPIADTTPVPEETGGDHESTETVGRASKLASSMLSRKNQLMSRIRQPNQNMEEGTEEQHDEALSQQQQQPNKTAEVASKLASQIGGKVFSKIRRPAATPATDDVPDDDSKQSPEQEEASSTTATTEGPSLVSKIRWSNVVRKHMRDDGDSSAAATAPSIPITNPSPIITEENKETDIKTPESPSLLDTVAKKESEEKESEDEETNHATIDEPPTEEEIKTTDLQQDDGLNQEQKEETVEKEDVENENVDAQVAAEMSMQEDESTEVKELDQSFTLSTVPLPKDNGMSAHSVLESLTDDAKMIVDMQGSLEDTMKEREEAELQVRQMSVKVEELENRLKDMDKMEDQVEQLNVTLVSLVAEKSKLEVEIGKMRDAREEAESRETVLSNRLNEAKKKEGVKANMVQKLDFENTEMQDEIVRLKQEVTQMTLSRDRLETGMEKLKKKCVERVKMAEGALEEERHLNDERKKKMKFFVETKAEELRVTKEEGDAFRTELEETRVSLRDTTNKLERMHTEWMSTQTRNRELQREMMTLRKSSNKLYKMGGNLELELEKSTQETEEHKNKRLTAKHELITLLRTLEGERSVTGKLRDSLKFTFTPKALSQQQLLVETLRDFEEGLTKLSRRLGKPLPPSSHQGIQSEEFGSNVLDAGVADMTNPENSTIDPEAIGSDKSNKKRNKADADSTRLVSSLERETQRVSQGIMALISNVERLHTLLSDAGDRNCMSVLNDFLATTQYNQTEGNNSNVIRRGNDDDQGNEESFNSFSNNVAGPRRFSRQPQYGPL